METGELGTQECNKVQFGFRLLVDVDWDMIAVLAWVHSTIATSRTAGKLTVRVVASLHPTNTHPLFDNSLLLTTNILFLQNYED